MRLDSSRYYRASGRPTDDRDVQRNAEKLYINPHQSVLYVANGPKKYIEVRRLRVVLGEGADVHAPGGSGLTRANSVTEQRVTK